jgi:hypothetical protein
MFVFKGSEELGAEETVASAVPFQKTGNMTSDDNPVAVLTVAVVPLFVVTGMVATVPQVTVHVAPDAPTDA